MQRKNILMGPGAAMIGGITLHDADGISVNIDSAAQDIPSSMDGLLDTIKTDQRGVAAFTPCGVVTQGIGQIGFVAHRRISDGMLYKVEMVA